MCVIIAATVMTVLWPTYSLQNRPSEIWRSPTSLELRGRELYIENGCTYCHSQYIRPQDWGYGAERIAKAGDYFDQQPHLLGSERTGPDLSQEGGEHPDDWHYAHFVNPRTTRPRSLMPRFAYVGKSDIRALTAYVQSLGGNWADKRMTEQARWKAEALAAYRLGADENIKWLHSRVQNGWRIVPSETVASHASITRGEKIYQEYCLGCHGPVGDGMGPAWPYLEPRPVNFTTLKRHLIDGNYIGGILYYQIMNGVTGSAMPYFKKDLESAKIWDVGNYVMVNFINWRDDRLPSPQIPPSYEGMYKVPTTPKPAPGPIGPNQGGVDGLP
jgi:cbb3-type cytochrome c oxidase subunit II